MVRRRGRPFKNDTLEIDGEVGIIICATQQLSRWHGRDSSHAVVYRALTPSQSTMALKTVMKHEEPPIRKGQHCRPRPQNS